ncbi:hypothetical protein PAMP_023336 [Pampus punctatissimus]
MGQERKRARFNPMKDSVLLCSYPSSSSPPTSYPDLSSPPLSPPPSSPFISITVGCSYISTWTQKQTPDTEYSVLHNGNHAEQEKKFLHTDTESHESCL